MSDVGMNEKKTDGWTDISRTCLVLDCWRHKKT